MIIFYALFFVHGVVGFVPSTTRILSGLSRVPQHAMPDYREEKVQRTRQLADVDVDDSESVLESARQKRALNKESWNVTQRAALKDYNRRIYEIGRRASVISRGRGLDANENYGWRRAVQLLTTLEMDHAAAPPNVFTLNAILVAALSGDQDMSSQGGAVAARSSIIGTSDGSDLRSAQERVEWAWLRLVGEPLPIIGRNSDNLSVNLAAATPLRGVWVVPDAVSLNTALKLWFTDSPSQVKYRVGSSNFEISGAEAFAHGVISRYGVQPDSATVNSLIRIACRSSSTSSVDSKRLHGDSSAMAPHMARAEALAAVLEAGGTIEVPYSDGLPNTIVADVAKVSNNIPGSNSRSGISSATEVTYCSLLVGHASSGRLDLAIDVFARRLQLANISPSAVTVSAMANALLDGIESTSVAAAQGLMPSDALALLNAAAASAFAAQTQASDSKLSSAMPFSFRSELLLTLGIGNPDSLWTDLSGVARLDQSFFNTVLKARRADGDLEGVLALLEAMGTPVARTSTQQHPTATNAPMNAFLGTSTDTTAVSETKPSAVVSGDYQRWRNAQGYSKRGSDNGEKVSSNAARRAQWLAMTKEEQAAALAKIDAKEAKRSPKQSEVPLPSLSFDSSIAAGKADGSAAATTAAAQGCGTDAVSLHTAVTACCDARKPDLALQLVAAHAIVSADSNSAMLQNWQSHRRAGVCTTAASFNPILQSFALGAPRNSINIDDDQNVAIEDKKAAEIWPLPLSDNVGLQRAWKLYMHMRRGDWSLVAYQKGAARKSTNSEIDVEAHETKHGDFNTALHPVKPDAWTCVAMAEGHLRAKEPINALLTFHLMASDLVFPNGWFQSSNTRRSSNVRVEERAAATAAVNTYLRVLAASRAAAAANAASGKFSTTSIQWQTPLRRGTVMSDKAIAAAERAITESGSRQACLAAAIDAVRVAASWGSADTQTMNGALAVCAACSSAAHTSDTILNSYDNLDKGVVLVGGSTSSGSNDWEINNRNEAFVGNAAAATALVLELLEDDCGVPRDMATVHLLIKGAANRGDLLTVFRYAARVITGNEKHVDPNARTEVGERRKGGKCLSDRTYSTLLGACMACNNLPEAIALLKHGSFFVMPSTGLSANTDASERDTWDEQALSALLPPSPPFSYGGGDMATTTEAATSTTVAGSQANLLPPRSRNSIYPPTLLRLLRALTANDPRGYSGSGNSKVATTKDLVAKRLEEAVYVLACQRPRVNDVDVTTNSAGVVTDTNQAAAVKAAASAAYVVVAEACVRGGKPQLLRIVMAAAAAEGVELQTRMSMSTDIPEGVGKMEFTSTFTHVITYLF